MKIDPNAPAYPTTWKNTGDRNDSAPNGEVVAPGNSVLLPGLTIRAEFAARAMQGLLAAKYDTEMRGYDGWREKFAREAIRYADALIDALNKEKPNAA